MSYMDEIVKKKKKNKLNKNYKNTLISYYILVIS